MLATPVAAATRVTSTVTTTINGVTSTQTITKEVEGNYYSINGREVTAEEAQEAIEKAKAEINLPSVDDIRKEVLGKLRLSR